MFSQEMTPGQKTLCQDPYGQKFMSEAVYSIYGLQKTIKFNKIVVDRAIYRPKIFQNSTKLVHNKEDSSDDDK